jgi:predicted GTPase
MAVSKNGIEKINYQMKAQDNECTMILLGESGVGKSTFINALANYLLHNSFEDARKQPMTYLIPASFTLTDKTTFSTVKVKCGEDENESSKVGMSCTQNARSHFLKMSNNKRLHIIDTPGIGDTGGQSQDAKNIANTLKYIGEYDKLNAICILVKPNHARLDLHFRYCLKELLVHLHRGAAPNIVFCFTNSRSTFYAPGDSFEPLKA